VIVKAQLGSRRFHWWKFHMWNFHQWNLTIDGERASPGRSAHGAADRPTSHSRYLVIVAGTPTRLGATVQLQAP
jgi:hypothetical protein